MNIIARVVAIVAIAVLFYALLEVRVGVKRWYVIAGTQLNARGATALSGPFLVRGPYPTMDTCYASGTKTFQQGRWTIIEGCGSFSAWKVARMENLDDALASMQQKNNAKK